MRSEQTIVVGKLEKKKEFGKSSCTGNVLVILNSITKKQSVMDCGLWEVTNC